MSAISRTAALEIAALADRYMARATPGPGLPIGGALNDEVRRCDAVRFYLRRVYEGATLEQAREDALAALREMVRTHNARRPQDIHWRRHDGTGPLGDMPNGADAVDLAHGIAVRDRRQSEIRSAA